ncbi:hypothetical protein EGJ52_03870 [Pseudomonas luteola]|uniref:hypothetical protein n=1 Tax=Pseudomonas luteola TaxID=47886 RepID=UPI000F770684|nr:hypothetical protein [Pseudomonas luteola]RRW46511.1 hypothetical protein EGJ52_03870 [Pseudomonas luteola]
MSHGVRYERLLFWAAPITLAAFAVFIATLGYNTLDERVKGRCYSEAARIVESKSQALQILWIKRVEQNKKSKATYLKDNNYRLAVGKVLIFGLDPGFDCWEKIKDNSDNHKNDGRVDLDQEPSVLVKAFNAKASELLSKPVNFNGIEIPDKATINIMGTKIQTAMSGFIQALQVALAPVMVLWLGSLYHTRLRESLKMNQSDDLLAVHPHVINIYPVGYYPDLRKKSFIKSAAPALWGGFFMILRITILAVFVAPSVIFYLWSLLYQPVFGYWSINFAAGTWVVLFSFGIFILESLTYDKHFHGTSPLR